MTQVNVTNINKTVVVHEVGASHPINVVKNATNTVKIIASGPQGPAGAPNIAYGALPTGGDPGNILIKQTYANYESEWVATLDGGTFN